MKKKRMNGLILAATAFMLLFMYGCSMSSSGNPGDELPLALEQFIIDTTGGDGSDPAGYGGNGGYGGNVEIGFYYGSGGDVKILDTGAADAGFTFPSSVTTYLGDNPLTITADTTVEVVIEMPAVDGTPYMMSSNNRIYMANTDAEAVLGDSDDQATGISVAAGVTLTLGLNYTSYAYIYTQNEMHNAGTITTAKQADGISSGGLRLYISGNYYGEAGSSITLTGIADPEGTTGGNGGYLNLDCGFYYNQGDINTSGAGDDDGGNAGSIDIYANMSSLNTGNLTAEGGDGVGDAEGEDGDGGDGNQVSIGSGYGGNFNSGDLTSNGGTGTDRGGFSRRVQL
ncbi:MAG: hypothetical protein GY850_31770, partial [bacterium]|nr:hypothetical protein [bacterium]